MQPRPISATTRPLRPNARFCNMFYFPLPCPAMEFGIFNSLYLPYHLRERDPEGAEHNRLMDEVAWTVAADKAGFKYTWATEHHFLDEYSHLSANESFLAYVAA